MLHRAKTLTGYRLQSLDGEIGRVKQFLFDDQHWAVRYLVADTGNWLTGRQVLISPYALGVVNGEAHDVLVALTRRQIRESPSLNTDAPVSRQFEERYYDYYGWPVYWSDQYMWGPYPSIERDPEKLSTSNRGGKPWDPHLRSTHDVAGHHVHATDGEIGHVDDFLIDDETWAIRYLVVDTRNWWPGKRILVSPRWIESISWPEARVSVSLSRQAIRNAPEYNEESLPTREYETTLHGHYNRPGYWIAELPTRKRR